MLATLSQTDWSCESMKSGRCNMAIAWVMSPLTGTTLPILQTCAAPMHMLMRMQVPYMQRHDDVAGRSIILELHKHMC